MSTLKKILFYMEEDGTEWIREFDGLLGNPEVNWHHRFLPETGEEEISLIIRRKTQQSIDYAAFLKSKGWFAR